MSGPHPPQQRRAGRSQPLTSGASSLTGFNAVSFEEWRTDTDDRMDRHDTALQKTALILERLTNRFDEHDRRINALEERPREAREARLGERNLTAQLWLVGCGLLTVLAYLLPHLSFH